MWEKWLQIQGVIGNHQSVGLIGLRNMLGTRGDLCGCYTNGVYEEGELTICLGHFLRALSSESEHVVRALDREKSLIQTESAFDIMQAIPSS